MKAMKMINSITTRGLVAFHSNKPFPAAVAASQKLTFSTTVAGNQLENPKQTLIGGGDQEIQSTPYFMLSDLAKRAVNSVKKLAHLVEFSVDHEGFAKCRLRTELFPSLAKLLKKSPVRVAVGNQGTTYFVPIPGISVEDDELNLFVFGNKLYIYANRYPAKAGGGIEFRFGVPLPEGFTMDDLTIAHVNGEMTVFVPYQKKEELVSKEEDQLVH